MPETFEYASLENQLFVRAPQRFCAPEAGDILEQAQLLAERHHCNQIVFELSACHYLDSTIMGQLLALHRRRGTDNLILSKPSPEARQILLIMGLDKLLKISDEALPPDLKYQTLSPERKNSADDILKAHELLSQISPDNARRFETLIKTLNQSRNKNQ